jgi:prepilin-type N-terminal cleavage/methylation domain-containing protein
VRQLRGGFEAGSAPRPSRGASGFTLVELMVVIAIIVALMAIIVPSYRALSANNQRAGCAANMKALGQALAIFREDYQCFPPDATEYLWTPEAVVDYENIYIAPPPGDSSVGTLVSAAYHPDGRPFVTGLRGLGLFTLYYLGAYSAQPPPLTSDPRIRDYPEYPGTSLETLRTDLERNGEGLNGLPWFRGSGYITKLGAYHCPANPADLFEENLVARAQLPTLGGWNGYDQYYRRNFWHPGAPTQFTDRRNLFQAYPPADTVVTWCPHHRRSEAPEGPGVEATPRPGDQDLVLFVDGTVRRMASQQANRMYQEPSPGAGWPEGPIM